MAAREQLGGLAPATRAAVAMLRAAFDWVVVETVGVGQSEVDVETVADTVVLVLQPGSGDTLQFMKAGDPRDPRRAGREQVRPRRARASARAPTSRAGSRMAQLAPGELAAAGDRRQQRRRREGIDAARACDRRSTARTSPTASSSSAARAAARAWALELFARRYGTLGLERAGGRAEAEQLVAKTPGSALDAFSALARRAGLPE